MGRPSSVTVKTSVSSVARVVSDMFAGSKYPKAAGSTSAGR
jgi:hypothetical protein